MIKFKCEVCEHEFKAMLHDKKCPKCDSVQTHPNEDIEEVTVTLDVIIKGNDWEDLGDLAATIANLLVEQEIVLDVTKYRAQ